MGEATFTWEDPREFSRFFLQLDSPERIKFFVETSKNPPMGELMNFKGGAEIDSDGSVTFTATPQEYHYNPIGSVHGGFAATMLDSCNSLTANCSLNKGYLSRTADIKVSYFRGITLGIGDMFAKGTIEKLGRKVIFVRGELFDTEGKVYATATSTEIVVEIK